jgi:AcrR family transcriptional regulator
VHAHFPTWEALLEAAVQRAVSRSAAVLSGVTAEDVPADRALERMIAAAWHHLSRNEAMAQAVSELLSPEAVTRTHRAAFAGISQLVRRGQAEGSFRTDLPADWLAHASIALLHQCNDGVMTGRMDADDALRIITTSIRDLACDTGHQ